MEHSQKQKRTTSQFDSKRSDIDDVFDRFQTFQPIIDLDRFSFYCSVNEKQPKFTPPIRKFWKNKSWRISSVSFNIVIDSMFSCVWTIHHLRIREKQGLKGNKDMSFDFIAFHSVDCLWMQLELFIGFRQILQRCCWQEIIALDALNWMRNSPWISYRHGHSDLNRGLLSK